MAKAKKSSKVAEPKPTGSKKIPVGKKKEASSSDNRDDLRIPVHLLVDYRSEGNYLFDFCRDLGAGGIFIQTPQPLDTGSTIDLTFTLPDSKETLHMKGKVIWSQRAVEERSDLNAGMGVQFTDYEPQHRKLLEDFVSRYHQEAEAQQAHHRSA